MSTLRWLRSVHRKFKVGLFMAEGMICLCVGALVFMAFSFLAGLALLTYILGAALLDESWKTFKKRRSR